MVNFGEKVEQTVVEPFGGGARSSHGVDDVNKDWAKQIVERPYDCKGEAVGARAGVVGGGDCLLYLMQGWERRQRLRVQRSVVAFKPLLDIGILDVLVLPDFRPCRCGNVRHGGWVRYWLFSGMIYAVEMGAVGGQVGSEGA